MKTYKTISIPFSPTFFHTLVEETSPEFGIHKAQTHNTKSIDFLFEEKNPERDDILKDIPRTQFQWAGEDRNQAYYLNNEGTKLFFAGGAGEAPIDQQKILEAKTVLAFTLTSHALQESGEFSPKCFLQGGYLRHMHGVGNNIMARVADGISTSFSRTALVITPHSSHLHVSYKYEATAERDNEHYMLHSTTLLKKDKKEIIHAILKDCGLKINAVLEERMIEAVAEQLNALTFNATAESFLFLVPFLYKKEIRELFVEKLLLTNDEAVIEKVNRFIVQCFDRRLKDLKRIDGVFREHRRASHLREWALLKMHCNKYQKELDDAMEKASSGENKQVLGKTSELLRALIASPSVQHFANLFHNPENKTILENANKIVKSDFISIAGRILVGIVGLFFIPAIYSKMTVGTFKFWQSPVEAHHEIMQDLIGSQRSLSRPA